MTMRRQFVCPAKTAKCISYGDVWHLRFHGLAEEPAGTWRDIGSTVPFFLKAASPPCSDSAAMTRQAFPNFAPSTEFSGRHPFGVRRPLTFPQDHSFGARYCPTMLGQINPWLPLSLIGHPHAPAR